MAEDMLSVSVWLQVFGYLPATPASCATLSAVCVRWNVILRLDAVWLAAYKHTVMTCAFPYTPIANNLPLPLREDEVRGVESEDGGACRHKRLSSMAWTEASRYSPRFPHEPHLEVQHGAWKQLTHGLRVALGGRTPQDGHAAVLSPAATSLFSASPGPLLRATAWPPPYTARYDGGPGSLRAWTQLPGAQGTMAGRRQVHAAALRPTATLPPGVVHHAHLRPIFDTTPTDSDAVFATAAAAAATAVAASVSNGAGAVGGAGAAAAAASPRSPTLPRLPSQARVPVPGVRIASSANIESVAVATLFNVLLYAPSKDELMAVLSQIQVRAWLRCDLV
ncbi:F-box protein [archaeon]|nr:MAG: F-box protein [archaeon]